MTESEILAGLKTRATILKSKTMQNETYDFSHCGFPVTAVVAVMRDNPNLPMSLLKVTTPQGERIVKALKKNHPMAAEIAKGESTGNLRGLFAKELHEKIHSGTIHGLLSSDRADVEKYLSAEGSPLKARRLKAWRVLIGAYQPTETIPAEKMALFARMNGLASSVYAGPTVEEEIAEQAGELREKDEQLGLLVRAATNVNRLHEPSNREWHAAFHAKGGAACLAEIKPLLAAHRFPVLAGIGEKIFHIRQLIVKHLAPAAEHPAQRVAPTAAGYTASRPGTTTTTADLIRAGKWAEAWESDAFLRREFSSGKALLAYVRNVPGARAGLAKDAEARAIKDTVTPTSGPPLTRQAVAALHEADEAFERIAPSCTFYQGRDGQEKSARVNFTIRPKRKN